MPTTFDQTQNYDIQSIIRDYLNDMVEDDAIMKLMPLTFKDASKVVWEQRDNFWGLMPLRGINGTPDVKQAPGSKRFAVDPGYYGVQLVIDEEMMTKQRELGSPNDVIAKEVLLDEAAREGAVMFFNRIRQMIVSLCTTGEFKIESRGGAKVHQYKVDGFNLATAATAWSNTTNGKPISDLLTIQNTLQLGTSSSFGEDSTMYMSPLLITKMVKTDQVMSTIKGPYGSTEEGLAGLNRILAGYGLGQIKPYNESYAAAVDTAQSSYTRFMDDLKFIWVGKRPKNQPFGEFVMTRNMVNEKPAGATPDYNEEPSGSAPEDWKRGLYTLVRYDVMPPMYTVDAGFNGGPAIHFKSAVAGITTT